MAISIRSLEPFNHHKITCGSCELRWGGSKSHLSFINSIGSSQTHGVVGQCLVMGLDLKLHMFRKTVNLTKPVARVMKYIVFLNININWYLNAVCGRNYSNSSGSLSSPLFPNFYPHNVDCSYLISQPPDSFINLNITQIDLNCHSMGSDYLELRDGMSKDSPLIGRFCGDNAPEFLQTTQNILWTYKLDHP